MKRKQTSIPDRIKQALKIYPTLPKQSSECMDCIKSGGQCPKHQEENNIRWIYRQHQLELASESLSNRQDSIPNNGCDLNHNED